MRHLSLHSSAALAQDPTHPQRGRKPTAMSKTLPEELYDYVKGVVVHADIASLDLEEGRWFKCKFCKNAKDWGVGKCRLSEREVIRGGAWKGV